jgi:ethanolamine utilization protein EutP (predicted NTPase)
MKREDMGGKKHCKQQNVKYELSLDIKREAACHEAMYKAIETLFMEYGMLYAVSSQAMGKATLLPEMLRIISCASLRWYKPYELIGEADFMSPRWSLAGLPSLSTVYRLRKLAEERCLICGFDNKSKKASYKQWHIALNIGEILLKGLPYVGAHYRRRGKPLADSTRKDIQIEPLRLCIQIIKHRDFPRLLDVISKYDVWKDRNSAIKIINSTYNPQRGITQLMDALNTELSNSHAVARYDGYSPNGRWLIENV